MKLKNSYILLIAIAILLISIGSVCASDDIANDDNMKLTSDQSDMVLEEGEDTTQEKINTTVNIPQDSYKVKNNTDIVIPVEVKDKDNNTISINGSDLLVSDYNKTIKFSLNSSGITLSDKLSVGNHFLLITYLGNSTYAGSAKQISVSVYYDKILEIPSVIVTDSWNNIEIPYIVTDGLTNSTVSRSDLNVLVSYVNADGNILYITPTYNVANNKINVLSIPDAVEVNITVNLTETQSVKTTKIKLKTSVVVSDAKINITADKNIPVAVQYNSDNLPLKYEYLKLMEGTKNIVFTYENGTIKIIDQTFGVGEHKLTVVFTGNATYAESSKNFTVKIFENSSFDAAPSANIDSNSNVNLQLNLTDGVDPVEIKKDNLKITLNYVDENNQVQSRVIDTFTVNQNTQIVTFKVTESFIKANLTVNYTTDEGQVSVKNTILKVNTVINAEDVTKGDGESYNFTASVTSDNGVALNVNDNNLKVYNGNKALNTTYNNSVITIHDKLTYGTYNLTIKFTGNETYSDASKDIVLKITGFNTNNVTSIDINSTKHGEIRLNVTDKTTSYPISLSDLEINATYKNGNDTVVLTLKNIALNNNTLTFDVDDDNFTTASLIIKYKGAQVNFTVNRIYNFYIIPISTTVDYQDGNFTFELRDLDTGELLPNKTVSITMKFNGTSVYFFRASSSGTTINTNSQLTSDANGILVLNNSGFNPNLVIADVVYGPVGEYDVTIATSGNVKGSNNTKITINMIDAIIRLETFDEYYGTDKKVTISIINSRTGKGISGVYAYINLTEASLPEPRQMTNSKGQIELGVTSLPANTYRLTFRTNDTNLKEVSGSGSFKISKIPVVISAKDLSIYYNSGTTATVKVTHNGVGEKGVYILLRLYTTSSKYNDYLFQTNSKGEFSFSAPLDVGKHKMIIVSADNRYDAKQVTKTITVKKASAKFTAPKVTAYYKQGKSFVVKVSNAKNKKAIYNAKVKILITTKTLKYKPITGTTGADGKLRLKITLNPGTYSVKISGGETKNFKASAITSKIVVKNAPTKLTPKKLTAKKGANKYFTVKVTNKKTKKIISGVKLKVKVKSKTYNIKSNSKGIAKLSTKSLKVGTYKVTVTSNNKYCVASTAKSTIKIKR